MLCDHEKQHMSAVDGVLCYSDALFRCAWLDAALWGMADTGSGVMNVVERLSEGSISPLRAALIGGHCVTRRIFSWGLHERCGRVL